MNITESINKSRHSNTPTNKISRVSGENKGQAEDSGKYPCGVCMECVGDNSIKCVAYHRSVHKKCSGIPGRLRYDADFRCRRCLGLDGDSSAQVSNWVRWVRGQVWRSVCPNFAIWVTFGWGVVEAARARFAWAVQGAFSYFNFASIVSKKGSKVLVSRVFWYMELKLIYGYETWAMKADDLRSLERTELMMVKWMCGVSLKDR